MLTPEQLAFRSRVIGGSDANIIMSGDAERIVQLWREKRGEIEREDLSDVLAVQMGSFTEPFNVAWFQKQTGCEVTHCGEERLSLDEPFMACTLDGLTYDGDAVFEAKHVSAFYKDDDVRAKYYPQLQHNMHVCGLSRGVLSVFFGNAKWSAIWIDADPIYQTQMIEAERDFWRCVETGEHPVAVHVEAPVEAIRTADMTGSNAWASAAADWLALRDGAKKFAASEKAIKGLVEADVIRAHGHGIEVKRDARGALRIAEERK